MPEHCYFVISAQIHVSSSVKSYCYRVRIRSQGSVELLENGFLFINGIAEVITVNSVASEV